MEPSAHAQGEKGKLNVQETLSMSEAHPVDQPKLLFNVSLT